jgi:hypothetical protein
VAPVEKVRTLKRAIEWASRSIRGLPVRAPQACRTGAAIANPTKSSAKNMCTSIVKPVKPLTPPGNVKFERSSWARKLSPAEVANKLIPQ